MRQLLFLLLLLPACGKQEMTTEEINTALSTESRINISDDDCTYNVFQLPPDNDDLIWLKMMKLQELISELTRLVSIHEMRIQQLEKLAASLEE